MGLPVLEGRQKIGPERPTPSETSRTPFGSNRKRRSTASCRRETSELFQHAGVGKWYSRVKVGACNDAATARSIFQTKRLNGRAASVRLSWSRNSRRSSLGFADA